MDWIAVDCEEGIFLEECLRSNGRDIRLSTLLFD
jgi:hypothetical protein